MKRKLFPKSITNITMAYFGKMELNICDSRNLFNMFGTSFTSFRLTVILSNGSLNWGLGMFSPWFCCYQDLLMLQRIWLWWQMALVKVLIFFFFLYWWNLKVKSKKDNATIFQNTLALVACALQPERLTTKWLTVVLLLGSKSYFK
jgi:hypothetical protein